MRCRWGSARYRRGRERFLFSTSPWSRRHSSEPLPAACFGDLDMTAFSTIQWGKSSKVHFTKTLSLLVTEAIILATLCTIGMLILRIPYALMVGCLIGVTALIPIIGAFIGGGIGAIMILTVSPVKASLPFSVLT